MSKTTATLHRILENTPVLIQAAALPTQHLERYLGRSLYTVSAQDISLTLAGGALAREILAPSTCAVAAMLAATTSYDEQSSFLEGLARDHYAANAARNGRHACAWGELTDAVPRIVDAWRRVIATQPHTEYRGVPPEEAALLLRRHRR